MQWEALCFWGFAAVTIVPALLIVLTRSIVRAAFWLLLALGGFAGFYALLGSDFLAVAQVLVYLGGVMVLILYGVMLTQRDEVLVRRRRRLHIIVPTIFATLGLVALMALTITGLDIESPVVKEAARAEQRGGTEGAPRLGALEPADLPQGAAVEVTLIGEGFPSDLDRDDLRFLLGEREDPDIRVLDVGAPDEARERVPCIVEVGYPVLGERRVVLGDLVLKGGATVVPGPHTPPLGDLLLTDHILAFEVASVLLLAAMVGAAYVARRVTHPREYSRA